MTNALYVPIEPQVGIKRDGTSLDGAQYIDGYWIRSYNDRAKKIGGYRILNLGNGELVRNLVSYAGPDSIYMFMGQPSAFSRIQITPDLISTAIVNRTPSGFVPNVNNTWSITSVSYTADDDRINYIFAAAIPNNLDISSTTECQVYYGVLSDSDPLTPLLNADDNLVTTTGGIVNLGSYLLNYGANGFVNWNDGASPINWPADNFFQFGSSAFVYAAPVRNGTTVTGLFWSLDCVALVSYDGSSKFIPSYISTSSTILSSNCVVSFDPYFFWIGINSFYMYNGAVVPLENITNKIWFFKNLNLAHKQKIRGFYNKKYGEIWWLCPMFGSTENNWALIYNIEKQVWSDSAYFYRSAALSSSSQMPYPIMTSSIPEVFNSTTTFPIWAHEYGVNRIDPLHETAIPASFTTNKFWSVDQAPVFVVDTVMPDIEQTGNILMNVNTQGYPKSTVQQSDDFIITPTTEFLTMREKGSIISFTFTSNELNGDFLFGKCMVKLLISNDQRPGPSTS